MLVRGQSTSCKPTMLGTTGFDQLLCWGSAGMGKPDATAHHASFVTFGVEVGSQEKPPSGCPRAKFPT